MLCLFLEHSDLPSFALVDKLCNEMCTPILYRTVRLLYRRAASSCLRTLAADPGTLSFGRDLAALVRDFFLAEHWSAETNSIYGDPPDFQKHLVASLERMTNVRTLRCKAYLRGLGVLSHLLTTPRPNLTAVELWAINSYPYDEGLEKLEGRRAGAEVLPQLTEIVLHVSGAPTPAAMSLLHSFIASHANAIVHLGVVSPVIEFVKALIPSLASFPALQHLEVTTDEIFTPGFGHMSPVKSLIVRNYNPSNMPRSPKIPDTHWPMLESLACPLQLVRCFLPPQRRAGRPISTLRLDFVAYEQDYGDATINYAPDWPYIYGPISYVSHSAVPLKHLHLQVHSGHLQGFVKMLLYLPKLESLVVALAESPRESDLMGLGRGFIARLPHLHTLLLSDVLRKFYRRNAAFGFARDLDMQRRCLAEYSRHSSALRRVAFTTELEWEKGNDGVWYPSRLPRKGKPTS
ncbi:hypothetical protein ACG7TL_002248 [Trametes sanguinea]